MRVARGYSRKVILIDRGDAGLGSGESLRDYLHCQCAQEELA